MLLVIATAFFGVLVMAAFAWRYAAEANRFEAHNKALADALVATNDETHTLRSQLALANAELAKPHPSTQAQHRARAANAERVNAELAGIAR